MTSAEKSFHTKTDPEADHGTGRECIVGDMPTVAATTLAELPFIPKTPLASALFQAAQAIDKSGEPLESPQVLLSRLAHSRGDTEKDVS